ncbi:MAG: patatin-like phospholipase family protein [Fusobacteriaceae bacterium]
MKKIKINFNTIFNFIIFITFYSSIFANNINSKNEILDSINEKINLLKHEQNKLELLKIQIEKKSIDLSQQFSKDKKPVIALVLSGGGARGAAHIGVLKVLEKYKIPIDFVVGTSIGSIVGSMYAAGYSPSEIEDLVLNMEFNELITNVTNEQIGGTLGKNTHNKYPLFLNIDKNLEFSAPSGLVNGQKIYLQLKNIFSSVEEVKDFDSLPRKLRIITTDLYTGKEIVLSEGDIALSVFKSMAIPSFLAPVQDGENFYIDGGITNNIPTDIALEMGADIIIAVDIIADEELVQNTENLSAVVSGIFNYSGAKNVAINRELADILIKPNLGQHGIIDFNDLSSLIDLGENAAEKVSSSLKKLENKDNFDILKSKYSTIRNKDFLIDNFSLKNSTLVSLEQVDSFDNNQLKNNFYTQEDLENWVEEIYSLSYVSRVFYEIEDNEIIFSILEKESSNLNFAFNYSSNLGASVRTGLAFKNFNSLKKNYFMDLSLSKYPHISLRTDFFPVFFNFNTISSMILGYQQSPFLIWKNGDNVSTFSTNNLYLENLNELNLSKNISLGINFKYNVIKTDYIEGSKEYDYFNFEKNYLKNSGYIFYENINKKNSIYGELFFGKDIFSQNNINFYGYIFASDFEKTITNNLSLNLSGNSGKIFGKNIPKNEFFKLGGIRTNLKNNYFSFYGLSTMQRHSSNFQNFSLDLKYSFLPNLNLVSRYNLAWLSDSFSIDHSKEKISGYGFGLEWETFFGPMDFIISNNSDKNNFLLQVYLGYTF